jgi:hypothetical protein
MLTLQKFQLPNINIDVMLMSCSSMLTTYDVNIELWVNVRTLEDVVHTNKNNIGTSKIHNFTNNWN